MPQATPSSTSCCPVPLKRPNEVVPTNWRCHRWCRSWFELHVTDVTSLRVHFFLKSPKLGSKSTMIKHYHLTIKTTAKSIIINQTWSSYTIRFFSQITTDQTKSHRTLASSKPPIFSKVLTTVSLPAGHQPPGYGAVYGGINAAGFSQGPSEQGKSMGHVLMTYPGGGKPGIQRWENGEWLFWDRDHPCSFVLRHIFFSIEDWNDHFYLLRTCDWGPLDLLLWTIARFRILSSLDANNVQPFITAKKTLQHSACFQLSNT